MWTRTIRGKAAALVAAAAMCGGAATVAAPASAQAASRDATYATALSGVIPCSIGAMYDIGCGRMVNGRLKVNRNAPHGSHINIKGIENGTWRNNVRLIDVAGDSRKEAVVIISASAGGVGWPNTVVVYDGNGKLLSTWDSGIAIQRGRKASADGAREATAFSRTRSTSVDLRVTNIAVGLQCAACGTGTDVYRLTKGKNQKPVFRLITRR